MVRFIVGAMAIAFVGRWLYQQFRDGRGVVEKATPNPVAATFWGTVAGFTSFVAHVGGPPYQVYALPLGLDPKVFTGTSVIFFAITNAVKLIPYFAARPVRRGQPHRLGGADADRAAGDARRRLAGAAGCGRRSSIRSPTPRSASSRSCWSTMACSTCLQRDDVARSMMRT